MNDFDEDRATPIAQRDPASDTSHQPTDEVLLTEPAAAPPTAPDPPVEPAVEDPTITRFKSCRWHETQDGDNLPEYCANRDVLPFAGKNAFSAEAWCPDCKLYKVRRTTKKRKSGDWDDYDE